MKWIKVTDKKPIIGQIVVAWMQNKQEPTCVRYEEDRFGPVWTELVEVDICYDREDLISHWMPLPKPPND